MRCQEQVACLKSGRQPSSLLLAAGGTGQMAGCACLQEQQQAECMFTAGCCESKSFWHMEGREEDGMRPDHNVIALSLVFLHKLSYWHWPHGLTIQRQLMQWLHQHSGQLVAA